MAGSIMNQKTDYPRQDYYTGPRVFSVSHQDYGGITVRARDEIGAVVTASRVWGVRWKMYTFYAYCVVNEVKT